MRVLDSLALLSPALARLLFHQRLQFLYGCVAADMVVGKNMADDEVHCHTWNVAYRLFSNTRTDAERAVGLGFLSHLAADVVAHNYFVPAKSVESFAARTTGHAYWELRFDQMVSSSPRVWETVSAVGRVHKGSAERFLQRQLRPSSVLLPIGASRRVFNSVMLLSRLERWRQALSRVAHRSPWPLEQHEVIEARRMSMANIFATLRHIEAPPGEAPDPTGRRNLDAARALRRQLKRLQRQRALSPRRWTPYFQEVRRGFRHGIDAPLALPPVESLAA